MLRQLVIIVIAGLACSFWPPRACALDSGRTMAQYMSDQWGIDRGFPGGSVTAVTQTRDGYLWIGTNKGLVRFDGFDFRVVGQATPTTLPIGAVQQLVVAAKVFCGYFCRTPRSCATTRENLNSAARKQSLGSPR